MRFAMFGTRDACPLATRACPWRYNNPGPGPLSISCLAKFGYDYRHTKQQHGNGDRSFS